LQAATANVLDLKDFKNSEGLGLEPL
jgi:hypothetical protein